MRWQKIWLIVIGGMAVPGFVAQAQTNRSSRSAIKSLPATAVTVSAKASWYQLKGSAKRVQLRRIGSLPAHGAAWQRIAQTTIRVHGRSQLYVEVQRGHQRGWLLASLVKPRRVTTPTKLKWGPRQSVAATNFTAKTSAALYRWHDEKMTVVGHLQRGHRYVQTAQMTATRGPRSQTYAWVTSATQSQHGWVLSSQLQPVSFGATFKLKASHGLTTYATTGSVLSKSRPVSTWVTLAGNGQFTTKHLPYLATKAYRKNPLQTQPDEITSAKHYGQNYHFKTTWFLPEQYPGRDLTDPQSAAFSADNHYLYVMYVDGREAGDNLQTGWVVRYDWRRLNQLGASTPGHMAILRRATQDLIRHHPSKLDKQVLAAIKVGPKFRSGHAQTMALNPKTGALWFIQSYGKYAKPDVMERLNPQTLTPDVAVNFTLGSTYLGSVLTFDDAGNAYIWTHQHGRVTFYTGQVSPQRVQFKVVPQGLASDPGHWAQSLGYNDSNGRLYLVADESITSVPAAQLGHLTTGMVGENDFNGRREFEGLIFMHHMNSGFLLTNRGVELMQFVNN